MTVAWEVCDSTLKLNLMALPFVNLLDMIEFYAVKLFSTLGFLGWKYFMHSRYTMSTYWKETYADKIVFEV